MKAVICGAGIGGLTTAAALRHHDIDAVVLERANEVKPLGSGLLIWSNAVKALGEIGLGDEVAAKGQTITLWRAADHRGKVLGTYPIGDLAARVGAPTVAIRRPALHEALIAATEGLVRPGAQVTSFSSRNGHVGVEIAGDGTETGDVLVGADGAVSTVRAQLTGDRSSPRYAGYVGWRAVIDGIDHPQAEREWFTIYWGRGARFVVYWVNESEMYWMGLVKAPAGYGADDPKARLQEHFGDFAELIPMMIDATPEERIVRSDISDRDPIERWGDGRVTLLGDAAHPMTPNLGQGACMAIEDGVVLARRLAASGDPEKALRAYEDARRERTAKLLKNSRRIGDLGCWANPLTVAVRNRILGLIIRGPGQKEQAEYMTFPG